MIYVDIAYSVLATITPDSLPVCYHTAGISLLATGGYYYEWSDGEYNQSIYVTPDTVTTYTVSVTDFFFSSCTATASVVVYPPTPDTTWQSPTLCSGDTLYVGTSAYTHSGTYTDMVTTYYGCPTVTITTLTVVPGIQAAISPPNPPACHTAPATTLTASGGSAYVWSNSTRIASITVSPQIPTTYTVTVSNGGVCSATASVLVYPASNDSTTQNASLCSGDTFHIGSHTYTQGGNYIDTLTGLYGCDSVVYTHLTITAAIHATITPSLPPHCHDSPTTLTAGGGNTFSWSPGGLTDSTITVNPASTTLYTVTVSNNGLCTATASVSVYPSTDSTFTLTQNKTIVCPGDSATICAAAGFSTYAWSNGDNTQCITASDEGNYYLTATNSLGCQATSNVAHLSFYVPTPVTISASGDTLTCYAAVSYQWYFDKGPIPGDTGQTIIAAQNGTYTVQITDNNGCTYSSSPLVTGIDNLIAGGRIKVYPNPNSTGAWQVEIAETLIGAQCRIWDAQGQVLYQGYLQNSQSTVYLNAAAGIYLMQINSMQKNYYVKLIQF